MCDLASGTAKYPSAESLSIEPKDIEPRHIEPKDIELKVVRLHPDAQLPCYAHADDSGMDLVAIAAQTIPAHQSALVPIGIAIELPIGTEAQVRPRSGLALNHSLTVLNTPGTVDAGYRGEIKVILINHAEKPFHIEKGMKIAQMVIMPILRANVAEVQQLSNSARGAGGFGSTGSLSPSISNHPAD